MWDVMELFFITFNINPGLEIKKYIGHLKQTCFMADGIIKI